MKEPGIKQKCRFCDAELSHIFISLGSAPLSNSFLRKEQLDAREPFYPLDVYVCRSCFLVQLPEYETPEKIFCEYVYFSSYSDTWVKHTRAYADKMVPMLNLGPGSLVVEIASNDGCLLKNFALKNVPVFGIEPARNVAEVARQNGVPTESVFFGTATAEKLASEGKKADLLLANNVLAHVPDINDFVAGLKILLKDQGIVTLEFPHLMKLIDENQFDTIYHEHFSYLSFVTVEKIFEKHGFELFDVEELPTHGGSLRIFGKRKKDSRWPVSGRVAALRQKETTAGHADLGYYDAFKKRVVVLRKDILGFFDKAKREGKVIVGYGAPAKGNTLLNYCGIGPDRLPYTVDKNPHKQKLFLPGSHIPIEAPDKIKETKPDYVLILPWNLKEEVTGQMSPIRKWGGKFVTFIPKVEVN